MRLIDILHSTVEHNTFTAPILTALAELEDDISSNASIKVGSCLGRWHSVSHYVPTL